MTLVMRKQTLTLSVLSPFFRTGSLAGKGLMRFFWAIWSRPSFFWYDNDKDLKVCFLVTRIMLYDDRTEQAFKPPHYSARQQNHTSMYSTLLDTPHHMYHVPVNNIPSRYMYFTKQCLIFIHSFPKEMQTLMCPFFVVPLGHWPWHRVLVILLNCLGIDLKKTAF